jgi:hypothetical protein
MEQSSIVGASSSPFSWKKVAIGFVAILGLVGTVAVISATSSGQPLRAYSLTSDFEEFSLFMERYEKEYANHDEMAYRFSVYLDNRDIVNAHNRYPSSYSLGINKFSDMT